jgi:hypothetical protein
VTHRLAVTMAAALGVVALAITLSLSGAFASGAVRHLTGVPPGQSQRQWLIRTCRGADKGAILLTVRDTRTGAAHSCWGASNPANWGPARTSPDYATIVGSFRIVGGPPPGESIRARGRVAFVRQQRVTSLVVKFVIVGATGRFIAHLSPGTWVVTGTTPQIRPTVNGACAAAKPIKVEANARTSVIVQCDIP